MKPLYETAIPDREDIKLGRAHQKGVLSRMPLEGNPRVLASIAKTARKPISGVSVRTRLTGLLERSRHIANPVNAQQAKDFFEGALAALDTKDHLKATTEMVAAARAGDAVQRAALARKIAVNVGHLIRAVGDWVQWYETITLAEDETAWLRNYVPQQIDVKVANADGTLTVRTARPNLEDNNPVGMFFLLSDIFVTKLFDPNKGDVSAAALGTIDISLDLAEKLDELLQLPFLVGTPNSVYTAAFVNDGTPAAHYHASSRIKTANFPAGNIIALASNGAGTLPRFDVIRAVDEYFSRFGTNFDPAGDMVPVEIRVASGVAPAFGNEFTPTSVANPLTESLFKNRSIIPYNGRNYIIVPDATLDPADKYAYVRSNLPAGLFFEKPAGAMVHREEKAIENEVETFERMLIGQALPVTSGPRVLAVKWKT